MPVTVDPMSVPFGFGMPDPNQPGGPSGPFDMASLGAMFSQLGQMMQNPGQQAGPVNWTMVKDTARQVLAQAGDPVVGEAEARAVTDAVRLADVWLDEATTLPATGAQPAAWSRSQWIESTLPMWRAYVQPIAEHVSQMTTSMLPQNMTELSAEELQESMPEQLRSMLPGGIPADMMAMLQPMMGMMQQLGAVSFSMQLGQSLAALSQEVVSVGDIGIPLVDSAACALLPTNIDALGEGLNISRDDVRLYLALRESAHERLFSHVPWLRARMIGAIEEYARGIRVDPERISEAMGGIDPSNPGNFEELLASGILQPQDTDEQRAARARLETLLALVEGWVDEVVTAAIGDRLPSAVALQETMRRRRAAGGPAEKTFGTLIGMELRPRLLREAATLFAAVRAADGVEGRDALWGHPDLLPDAEDLADPLGFVERSRMEFPGLDEPDAG